MLAPENSSRGEETYIFCPPDDIIVPYPTLSDNTFSGVIADNEADATYTGDAKAESSGCVL